MKNMPTPTSQSLAIETPRAEVPVRTKSNTRYIMFTRIISTSKVMVSFQDGRFRKDWLLHANTSGHIRISARQISQRGKKRKQNFIILLIKAGLPFWDLVVVSAGDVSQEAWYEAQLQLKQEAGELPKVPFLCVADPPGPRVGSGGSTLHILALLESKYPGMLDKWKVQATVYKTVKKSFVDYFPTSPRC